MTSAHHDFSVQAIHDAVLKQRAFATAFFDDLAAVSTDPDGGITRDTYGPGENAGHRVMTRHARDSGFEVTVDPAGNSYARWRGDDPTRMIIMGSHLDSVPRGGNFDGAAGPVAGLVAMRALKSLSVTPRVDFCSMGIRAEESVWFQTSYIGSRAALGTLPPETYDRARRIDTGRTLAQHMSECGCDVAALRAGHRAIDPACVAAYIELHIEQAPTLVEEGKPLGICTGIPGNYRYPNARIIGRHDHVGTPRRFRHDAAMAAANLAMRMDRLWAENEARRKPMAITFGRFHTDPDFHGLTTVPGLYHFSLDVRAYDDATIAAAETDFLHIVAEIERIHGVTIELGERKSAPVGLVDKDLRERLVRVTETLAVPFIDLGSPASHDAAAFAAAGVPMAMLFVRNENGSHNPAEAMEIDDFLAGCAVLAGYLHQNCRH